MRQYVLRIELTEQDSEDLEFTIIRDDGTDVEKHFTDTLMVGLERASRFIAENYSDDPL